MRASLPFYAPPPQFTYIFCFLLLQTCSFKRIFYFCGCFHLSLTNLIKGLRDILFSTCIFLEKPFLELNADIYVRVGGSVNEVCKAIGNPEPKVFWRQKKSGKRVSYERHSSRYAACLCLINTNTRFFIRNLDRLLVLKVS